MSLEIPADSPNPQLVLEADLLRVDQSLQGRGYGAMLTIGVGIVASLHGIDEIDIAFKHPASLKHCFAVFGTGRICFYGENPDDTLRQGAQQALEYVIESYASAPWKRRKHGAVDLKRTHSLKARVDVRALDTTG